MAGRIAAGRGLAITYKMQVQQPTKTFCNFMQKRLAKNILTLVPLKMMAGGAHANSRKMCSLISYSVFFMVLLLSQVSVGNYYILQFILFLLLIGVVIMTPVEYSG